MNRGVYILLRGHSHARLLKPLIWMAITSRLVPLPFLASGFFIICPISGETPMCSVLSAGIRSMGSRSHNGPTSPLVEVLVSVLVCHLQSLRHVCCLPPSSSITH